MSTRRLAIFSLSLHADIFLLYTYCYTVTKPSCLGEIQNRMMDSLRCATLPEIRSQILELLTRSQLLNIALSHPIFITTAIDHIWRAPPRLSYLFNTLPSHVVVLGGTLGKNLVGALSILPENRVLTLIASDFPDRRLPRV